MSRSREVSIALCAIALWAQISTGTDVIQAQTSKPGSARPTSVCADPVLEGAKKLAEEGQYERAESVAIPLLSNKETAVCAAEVITNVAQKRDANRLNDSISDALDSATSIAKWLLVLAPIALVGFVLRICSFLRRRRKTTPWKIRHIAPGSDDGVVAAWRCAVEDQTASTHTAPGLLSLGSVPVPRTLIVTGNNLANFASILEGAPEIGGVSGSWMGRLTMNLAHLCQSARRTVSVSVTASERSFLMRVNLTDAENRFSSVAVSRSWEATNNSAEEIRDMAGEMAIRTAYLMAGEVIDGRHDARIKLQEGLVRLNDFVMRHESAALDLAARAFEETRRIDPADLDAAMLEGIVRELQQQPERAASLFQFVIERSELGSPIHGRARYNLAISYLRQYKVAPLQKAETLLNALLTDSNVTSPDLKAFARAALANVIAHKLIFWYEIDPSGQPDFTKWSGEQRGRKISQLQEWATRFSAQLDEATAALSGKDFQTDSPARTQLQWLIENAKGNFALNQANRAAAPFELDSEEQKRKLLENALAAFRRCEALIPAGVETLTNIATALLALGRPSEAISYTKQARTLNPRYEYAYYREAKALLHRNERDACKVLLDNADTLLGSIAIPSFKEIFKELGVQYHEDR
jgi:tetratricopeptide (TPR) repeat protein